MWAYRNRRDPRRRDVNRNHPLMKGCTGFWPLREHSGLTTLDLGSLKIDGTFTSSGTEGVPRRVSGFRNLGGVDASDSNYADGNEGGAVVVPGTITNWINNTSGAISCWVQLGGLAGTSAFPNSNGEGIVTFGSDGGAGVGLFRTGLTSGDMADSIFACVRPLSGPTNVQYHTSNLLSGWNHLVWVLSPIGGGTHPNTLYLGANGRLVGSSEVEDDSPLSTGIKIAKGNARSLSGQVSDVRVWNRVITDDEIWSLFANPDAVYMPHRRYWTVDDPVIPPTVTTTTFLAGAANRAQAWTILLTIEGIGEAEGLWKFCNRVPAYAAGASNEATYKPWLEKDSWPQNLSEQVDELGGIPKCGELAASIVDIDDLLVGQMRTDQAAVTTVDGDIGRSSSTLDVLDASVIDVDQVVYIRNEALRVTDVVGSTLTVTRAQLDTEAQAHEDGSPVFAATPYLRSRILRLRLAPHDGSADQETVLSTNYLDKIALSGDLNCWDVAGRSQLKFLSRLICGQRARWNFFGFSYMQVSLNHMTGGHDDNISDLTLWDDDVAFLKIGDEILRTTPINVSSRTLFTRLIQERAQAGTKEDDHKSGEAVFHVLNGTEAYSSFRMSPGPSPSEVRSDPDWTIASTGSGGVHFVDALLCMLTSSARLDDGYELTNYDPAYGNWSSLPPGYGIGVPYTQIDFASFIDVKARTPNWTFPNLIVGEESIPFADWAEKNFLKPLGIFMTMASGRLRLVMPRAPLVGEEATEWDFTVALRDGDTATGLTAPPALNTDTASSITFKFKTPLGDDVTETIASADAAQFYSQGGYYALDENAITLELPGARSDQAGFNGFVRQLGLRRLYKLAKPRWTLKLRTDLSQYALNPGDSVAITHSQLPDLRTGTRGWTSVLMTILEKTLSLSPAFFGFEWVVTGPGPDSARHGRVCPAANITSVSGAGPFVCHVSTNRYTSPDAADGLPVTDAEAFTVGDRVRIVNRDGSAAAAVFSTVTAVGTDQVSVSSDFGGALVANQQLIFANYDDSLGTDQATLYTYFADGTDFTIGSSDEPPFTYGE